MFSNQRDASKVALVALVERLRDGGYVLLDTQFVTDHLRRFGAIEVSRDMYQRLLRRAIDTEGRFYSDGRGTMTIPPWSSWVDSIGSSQSTTQTS
jgi:leucyl/phenylalanyl-tRNA--protein transferase